MAIPIYQTLRYVTSHPLNTARPLAALARFVRWQLATRLRAGPRDVPFVDDAVLRVVRGMSGATGNVYCGLHEYADMGFAMHFLRADDLFVDVGANVGSYTVLASAVCGARSIAFEPAQPALSGLRGNIAANNVGDLVDVRVQAVCGKPGPRRFTSGQDSTNRLVDADYRGAGEIVPSTTLDMALAGMSPMLIKIDVEGAEAEVLQGAVQLLGSGTPQALIVEVSCPEREALIEGLIAAGYACCRYEPRTRDLQVLKTAPKTANVLFLRDPGSAQQRLQAAPTRHVRAPGVRL